MAKWSGLPDELWQLILHKVPLPDRLGSCSRVCKKLCKAAAAATQQLELDFNSCAQRSLGFKDWLEQHGKHVLSLQLTLLAGDLAELPCQHLCQLRLQDCSVQLGASSSQPGILPCCSALTQLHVNRSCVTNGAQDLEALAAVPALQELKLAQLKPPQHGLVQPSLNEPPVFKLPAAVLQQLTQLTSLQLSDGVRVTAASMQHISSLQHLLELLLSAPGLALSPSSTPGLMSLTALHTLHLHQLAFDPAVLCGCIQLQHLNLLGVRILGAPDATQLLSFISRQVQLQELTLFGQQHVQPAAPAAYTALTASSELQQLWLCNCPLPDGVWEAVFRPAQQLPALQCCVILYCSVLLDDTNAAEPHLSSENIGALASCCLGLQELCMHVQPDVQLAGLSQLTALTTLDAFGVTEASLQSLAAVTQLRSVDIRTSCPVGDGALLPLTALQQLTTVQVRYNGTTVLDLHNKSPDVDEPNVWRQLLERCSGRSRQHWWQYWWRHWWRQQ